MHWGIRAAMMAVTPSLLQLLTFLKVVISIHFWFAAILRLVFIVAANIIGLLEWV